MVNNVFIVSYAVMIVNCQVSNGVQLMLLELKYIVEVINKMICKFQSGDWRIHIENRYSMNESEFSIDEMPPENGIFIIFQHLLSF